jgi:glucose/mannose transport system substrate-binding protein
MDGAFANTVSRRASRRTLVKGGVALGAMTLLAGRLPLGRAAAAGKLEIFSWWTSPGEAPALQSLFDSFKAKYPDVDIVNAAVAGGGGGPAQAVLQTRLQGKNPPDSWQTHVGRELVDQYVAPGYCEPLTSMYVDQKWLDVIPQGLVDGASYNGDQWSIPVGVHRGNDLFYNKKVMSDAGIELNEKMSVDDFFKAADALKAKNLPALAMGTKDSFVAAQTFENTLLGVVGPDSYTKLFKGEMNWDDASVKEAMQTFAKMLGYVNPDHDALTWDDATHLVIQGKAGMNVMGDWAYGEVVALKAQADMGWSNHPGTEGSFIYVVDSFTLPVGAPDHDNAENWLRVIGSKEAQEKFNPIKGSISPRTDVDQSVYDDYHKWSAASFAKDKLLPSCAHGEASAPAFKQSFYDAATTFINDLDVDEFASALVGAQNAQATATS